MENLMSKFKKEFEPDQLLMALFVENIELKANMEVCKAQIARLMAQSGHNRDSVQQIFAEKGKQALEKIISEHKYLSNEWKEELKKNLTID